MAVEKKTSVYTLPRDPANSLRDAALALHSVDELARRVVRLAYGFEDEGILYFDDEVAELLNADPTILSHYDAARVERIRTEALARMRVILELAPALPDPWRETYDDSDLFPDLGFTRAPYPDPQRAASRGLRQVTPGEAFLASMRHESPEEGVEGHGAPAPVTIGELASGGFPWHDDDIIGRDRDDAARWIIAAHGAEALDGFPLAHRGATRVPAATRRRLDELHEGLSQQTP